MNRYLNIIFAFTLLCLANTASCTPTLTADTNRPESSMFSLGEQVLLSFSATNLGVSATSLSLIIKDENDAVVKTDLLTVTPNSSGAWSTYYLAPSNLGFYRVFASIGGTTVSSLQWSNRVGALTYAVVLDPKLRQNYPEAYTRFGMQGGFSQGANILPYLGIRWVINGFQWGELEADHAGQFSESITAAGGNFPPQNTAVEGLLNVDGSSWNVYSLPSLFSSTPSWATDSSSSRRYRTLNSAGEIGWANYCKAVGKQFPIRFPNRGNHLYQITWEPWVDSYLNGGNTDGDSSNILRIYQLCYSALHESDPNAVVLGSTDGLGGGVERAFVTALYNKGLGNYIDAASMHPYYSGYDTVPTWPESNAEGLSNALTIFKNLLPTNKTLKIYGTEQGYGHPGGNVTAEIDQAKGLLRTNLMSLGEGLSMNISFYSSDYGPENGTTYYGYFYNLTNHQWGPEKIAPKVIAPGYATQSFLIDGYASATKVTNTIPTSVYAYRFTKADTSSTMAIWSGTNLPISFSLPLSGCTSPKIYDWMGRITSEPSGDTVSITATDSPVYLTCQPNQITATPVPSPTASPTPSPTATPTPISPINQTVLRCRFLNIKKVEVRLSMKNNSSPKSLLPVSVFKSGINVGNTSTLTKTGNTYVANILIKSRMIMSDRRLVKVQLKNNQACIPFSG